MPNVILAIILINGLSGKIQGRVKDADTGEPISYADVIILGTEIGTATDDEGYFFILNVPPGNYTVEVSCIGYQTKQIENVLVEIDHIARLSIELTPTLIQIAPVTVTSETPAVKKDYVSATYIVRKSELPHLPVDYSTKLVAFQAGVAHTDTALHVRGGRATEVQYMIDNVSIIDPQTGDPAINISKGIVNEVIFLPGGFDVEYGRAMSGVINMVTENPEERLGVRVYGKTERIMPFYYDFGYENFQSSIHLPVTKKLRGLISLDIMHTDDWNPKLYILPHKQRDDYSLYAKFSVIPSGIFKLNLSGIKSRIQFDRYSTEWKFNLSHYRSDMRTSDLQILNINFLPDARRFFNLTLSRLYTNRIYGVREENGGGLFGEFSFRDYHSLSWPTKSNKNPFGVSGLVISEGDYIEYQNKVSEVLTAKLNATLQLHKYHEIKTGGEYVYQKFDNFTYFLTGDTLNPTTDVYKYHPLEHSLYFQDNIDYKGLYAKLGCRYDYFSSDIEDISPKFNIAPRIGFSFLVTETFLLRLNIGRYIQPPLYDYMYRYYSIWPLPSHLISMHHIPPVGNPRLGPEKTMSYELGMQGEIRKDLILTINSFSKDVSDLIGTRIIEAAPRNYVTYFNVESASIKGLEMVLDLSYPLFEGKISYTLSWAQGSSSYAEEVYYRYYYNNPDSIINLKAREYALDFDQRNRIFIQGITKLPLDSQLHLFVYLGNGYPYTPPGPEGKYEERNIIRLPFQKQVDCVISRSFRIGKFVMNADFEIINLLDQRYEISPHFPVIPLEDIKKENFTYYIAISSSHYHPAADFNHDGLIVPQEAYSAYRDLVQATDDWVNAYTAPRRARLGVEISFQ
ncbi:MAG TPA: TonB-dependent receptor [candidate division WOR-3 bacterium]|uniref:TonB-dependent receptor n=1 Tax=candidate division WOR-3 bacterium TaxID=2052148 RepID=A0A9C9EML5_UNCW3|nr:TonB-dependent receptor [candidate division WOR-3 bacterium]